MSFFKKLGRGIKKGVSKVGSIFKKGGSEIGSALKKSGSAIGQGLGSLAGGSLGSSLAEGVALAVAPEFALPAMAVGGIIGSRVGGELGKRTGKILTADKPKPSIVLHNTVHRGIPDGKYFRQPSTGGGGRLGANGGGQRKFDFDDMSLFDSKFKPSQPVKNMLERSKPNPKPERIQIV